MNPTGPLIATLIVLSLGGGWAAVRAFAARCARVRGIGLGIWATALLLPILLVGIASAVTVATGAPWSPTAAAATLPNALAQSVFIFIFIGLGEEPGWRGYVLPTLQERLNPAMATLVLIVIGFIWHWPLFGVEQELNAVPAFAIMLSGGYVVFTWLTNAARGGVLPAMLFHTSVNTFGGGFFFKLFEGTDQLRLWWVFAALYGVTGVVILIATRGRLGFTEAARGAPFESSLKRG